MWPQSSTCQSSLACEISKEGVNYIKQLQLQSLISNCVIICFVFSTFKWLWLMMMLCSQSTVSENVQFTFNIIVFSALCECNILHSWVWNTLSFLTELCLTSKIFQQEKQTALCVRRGASDTSSGTVTVTGRELPRTQRAPRPASIKTGLPPKKRALFEILAPSNK